MEAHTDSLSLFAPSAINTAILNSQEIEHLPTSNFASGFIEFNINSQNYIDLNRTRLYLKCKLTLGESGTISHIEKIEGYNPKGDVGLSNSFMGSLFQKVDFSINQQNLTRDIPAYAHSYKVIFDHILSGCPDNPAFLYIKDDAKAIKACSIWKALEENPDNAIGNDALKNRTEFASKGQEFEMLGSLGVDFTQQNRYLIPNTNISIKLWQSNPAFALLSSKLNQDFRVKILEAKIKLCHVKLDPFVSDAIANSIKLTPVQYPFISSRINLHSIPKGSQTCVINNIFSNDCPDKLFVCLVNTQAFTGSFQFNAFVFEHFNISEIGFYLNNQSLPAKPLQFHFGESAHQSLYIEAWQRLTSLNKEIRISFEDFYRGFTIFSFDLTNRVDSNILTNITRGETKLELRFAKPIDTPITTIIYGKFNSLLTIDESGSTILQ